VLSELLSDNDQKSLGLLYWPPNGGNVVQEVFSTQGAESRPQRHHGKRFGSIIVADRPVRLRIEKPRNLYAVASFFIPPNETPNRKSGGLLGASVMNFRSIQPELTFRVDILDRLQLQGGTGQLLLGQYRGSDPEDIVTKLGAEELKISTKHSPFDWYRLRKFPGRFQGRLWPTIATTSN